jgi:MFS family permease
VPPAMRGRAFAVFGAVASGANVAGLLLGGVLLDVVPVRAAIAAAGLGGLAATAAFALPVLRAIAGERVTARNPDRASGPDQASGPDRASGCDQASGHDRGSRAGQRELDNRINGTGQVSTDRRAGAAKPGRPLR